MYYNIIYSLLCSGRFLISKYELIKHNQCEYDHILMSYSTVHTSHVFNCVCSNDELPLRENMRWAGMASDHHGLLIILKHWLSSSLSPLPCSWCVVGVCGCCTLVVDEEIPLLCKALWVPRKALYNCKKIWIIIRWSCADMWWTAETSLCSYYPVLSRYRLGSNVNKQ